MSVVVLAAVRGLGASHNWQKIVEDSPSLLGTSTARIDPDQRTVESGLVREEQFVVVPQAYLLGAGCAPGGQKQ